MRAISIRNPWADLIAHGKKTIETRTWATKYRGPLLICASKSPAGPNAGHAVCIVDLVDVRPMRKSDEKRACCRLYDGANAWVLKNVRRIKPFPVSGKLGLYDVTL